MFSIDSKFWLTMYKDVLQGEIKKYFRVCGWVTSKKESHPGGAPGTKLFFGLMTESLLLRP